jgi:hypothetical protein
MECRYSQDETRKYDMKIKHKDFLYQEKTLRGAEYGTWVRVIRKYCLLV